MLTPGMAYPCSLAASRRSVRAVPVTTPGLTEAGNLANAYIIVGYRILSIRYVLLVFICFCNSYIDIVSSALVDCIVYIISYRLDI